MKKILLGLFFICTIVEASSAKLPEDRTSPRRPSATTQAVTADDLLQMHRYFKDAYYPLIKALREEGRVRRDDILRAYERDLFLIRTHDGGHGTFKHKILPLKFGVIAHGRGNINVDERKGHHANLQVYGNVIKLFCQPILNIHEASVASKTMSQSEWQESYGAKLNEVVQAFNAMSTADWSERIKAQAAAFEEYSRD